MLSRDACRRGTWERRVRCRLVLLILPDAPLLAFREQPRKGCPNPLERSSVRLQLYVKVGTGCASSSRISTLSACGRRVAPRRWCEAGNAGRNVRADGMIWLILADSVSDLAGWLYLFRNAQSLSTLLERTGGVSGLLMRCVGRCRRVGDTCSFPKSLVHQCDPHESPASRRQ